MIDHLGRVLRREREARGVRLIHIAARLEKSEAAMSRFELGHVQPNDVMGVVEAYSRELGISPRELWRMALRQWDEDDADEHPPHLKDMPLRHTAGEPGGTGPGISSTESEDDQQSVA